MLCAKTTPKITPNIVPLIPIIDPTNACNLGCPLCPTGLGASTRAKKIMTFETFSEVLFLFL